MSEYIIEWDGIGTEIVHLCGSTEPHLISKRLRHRLKNSVVRCCDCRHWDGSVCDYLKDADTGISLFMEGNDYCSLAER